MGQRQDSTEGRVVLDLLNWFGLGYKLVAVEPNEACVCQFCVTYTFF